MDTEANRAATTPQTTCREVVSGVRRVWGTLRSASCTTIKNTIYFVTKVDPVKDMHIKRKVQTSDRTGKDRWWFLLHGAETDLKSLEEAWESLKVQTGWQLETCTKPVVTPPTTNQLPSPDNNNSSSSRVSCTQTGVTSKSNSNSLAQSLEPSDSSDTTPPLQPNPLLCTSNASTETSSQSATPSTDTSSQVLNGSTENVDSHVLSHNSSFRSSQELPPLT